MDIPEYCASDIILFRMVTSPLFVVVVVVVVVVGRKQ
jgi:hypothetical protein